MPWISAPFRYSLMMWDFSWLQGLHILIFGCLLWHGITGSKLVNPFRIFGATSKSQIILCCGCILGSPLWAVVYTILVCFSAISSWMWVHCVGVVRTSLVKISATDTAKEITIRGNCKALNYLQNYEMVLGGKDRIERQDGDIDWLGWDNMVLYRYKFF